MIAGNNAQIVSSRNPIAPILTLLSAVAVAVLGVFLLHQFEAIQADYEITLSSAMMTVLSYRNWFPLLALPAVVMCIAAIAAREPALRWILTIIATLSLIGPVAVLVFAAITTIAPLYGGE